MHYPIYIFTKEFPTNEVLGSILAPYSDEADPWKNSSGNHPDIQWDWWTIGGRYGGFLKIKCEKDNDDRYQWMCFTKDNKAGRLFRSEFLEEYSRRMKNCLGYHEVYAFLYCGYRDGYIYADGAKISDLINYEDLLHKGYAFIDSMHDELQSREYFDGEKFVENEQYDEQLAAAMERNKDGYLTVVDIHD